MNQFDPNMTAEDYAREAAEERRQCSYCAWCGAAIPTGECWCDGPGSDCWHAFTASVEQDRLEQDGDA